MRRNSLSLAAALAGAVTITAAGCGGDGDATGGEDRPTVAVTTPILGDVVRQLVGDDADVTVVMAAGVDPHDFQPSPRQATAMREADLLVTNGGGFEAGLDDTIEDIEAGGTPVFAAVDHVPTIRAGRDAGHGEDEGDDHTDEGIDPHVFTDPARMATMAAALSEELAGEVPALDTPRARGRAAAYVAQLEALDREVAETLAVVPLERRKLVTNHDVFAYFAERYDFEVVGAVIPSATTQAAASAGQIDDLASLVTAEGIPAVFADTSSPDDLAAALAAEAGSEVAVVELYSESLGGEGSGADTYAGMVRTNAARIADALAPGTATPGPG